MIDRFSKQQFEDALPKDKDTHEPVWEYYGFDKGEHTYLIRVGEKHIGVLIRSSIKMDGYAATSGSDSIRLTLINTETGKPLAKKVDAWTQRTYGWDTRMEEKIKTLYKKGMDMVDCPQCGKGTLSKREGKYGVFYGCSNYPQCKYTTNSLANLKVKALKPETIIEDKDEDIDFGAVFESLDAEDFSFYDAEDDVPTPPPASTIQLNTQQAAYVYAPINADIRVMASPGSGKTAASIERIVYLIDEGIDPNNIVYVTFTKSMATEGYDRIKERIPEVTSSNLSKQVCTIHALCFRLLRWEGMKRQLPKEWQIKQSINDIVAGDDRKKIKGEWQHTIDKPGHKEVLYWIDNAKNNGITSDHDIAYFVLYMPHDQAQLVHNSRKRFDQWLRDNDFITFADMPYLVELRLRNDSQFRNKYQKRFTHIIVDECQDTNEQALIVLMTLSLDPGDNHVFEINKKGAM